MSLICMKFRNIGMLFSPNVLSSVLVDAINIKIFKLRIKRTHVIKINIGLSPCGLINSQRGSLK